MVFILSHHILIQPRSIAIGGKLFAEEMKEVPQMSRPSFWIFHHQEKLSNVVDMLSQQQTSPSPRPKGSWLEMSLYEASVHRSNAMVAQYLHTIRRVPLQDLYHSNLSLQKLVGKVAALGKLEDVLDIVVSQLGKSPKCGFGFSLLAR